MSSRLPSKTLNVRMHKIVLLPVVLYGRDTWPFTLTKEHKVRCLKTKY